MPFQIGAIFDIHQMHHAPIIVQHWVKFGIIFEKNLEKIMKQSLFTSKARWILQKTAGIFIACKIEGEKKWKVAKTPGTFGKISEIETWHRDKRKWGERKDAEKFGKGCKFREDMAHFWKSRNFRHMNISRKMHIRTNYDSRKVQEFIQIIFLWMKSHLRLQISKKNQYPGHYSKMYIGNLGIKNLWQK